MSHFNRNYSKQLVFGWTTLVALVVNLCAVVGCGKSGGVVAVRGVIKIDGVPAPSAGSVTFAVLEPSAGFPATSGGARFQPGGEFVAQSGAGLAGLYPGKYAVAVECWSSPPRMDAPPPKSLVDLKYVKPQTSALTLEIEPGQDVVEVDYELQAKAAK